MKIIEQGITMFYLTGFFEFIILKYLLQLIIFFCSGYIFIWKWLKCQFGIMTLQQTYLFKLTYHKEISFNHPVMLLVVDIYVFAKLARNISRWLLICFSRKAVNFFVSNYQIMCIAPRMLTEMIFDPPFYCSKYEHMYFEQLKNDWRVLC